MKSLSVSPIAPALLVTLALMAGCARFQAKPLLPAQTALDLEARTLANSDLKQFLEANLQHEIDPWPPKSWDFETLTLIALYYHPDLDVARAQLGVAEAGKITAGQRPNPSVSFSPTFVSNASVLPAWIWGLVLSVPIETAGKRRLRLVQARYLSEAARINLATVAWQVHSRLRTSLFSLYAAKHTETVLTRQLSVQEELVRILEHRLAWGEVPQPEVTLAHIALTQNRLALREAQRQAAEARVQLATALGLPVRALEETAISFAALEQLVPLAADPSLGGLSTAG